MIRQVIDGRRMLIAGLCAIVPQLLTADVVHLANGRSLEGVILEESSTQVLLRLPFGEIGLPQTSIVRLERSESSLQEFLDRRATLESTASGAGDWLELALWADRQELDHSARQAVLVAARLDPGLPGLAPLMTAMGFAYEENLAVWLPIEDFMRRRGYVQSNGRWLTAEEAAAQARFRQAAATEEAERHRRDRLARALEMMAAAQMMRAEEDRRLREEAAAVGNGIPLWGGYPVLVAPGYWPRPALHPVAHRRGHGSQRRHSESGARAAPHQAIVARPPGSLIPVASPRSHRGALKTPPDPH